jgi:redox-sensitive bicupin YhaK (pirin superfamily)
MLDEAFVTPPAGFPDHPHRGFETVSYMLEGSFTHEDFLGHKGVLNPGDLQWMTAGRGILHSELPAGNSPTRGLQLWVNLPKSLKMVQPAYQELKDSQIPRASNNGVHVKIIAGESMGIRSPVLTRTPTMYLDFRLDPNSSFTQSIPQGWNAFIFILEGVGRFGPEGKRVEAKAHHTVLLGQGNSVSFSNSGSSQLRFVLIAGQPIGEPSKL